MPNQPTHKTTGRDFADGWFGWRIPPKGIMYQNFVPLQRTAKASENGKPWETIPVQMAEMFRGELDKQKPIAIGMH